MSEHNETLAEIAAALRHNSKGLMFYLRKNEDGSTHAMGADYVDLADRIEAAAKRERGEMLDVIVRIGNWCAQDLAENAYTSDSSGNYLKTLNGLCEVCRPFMRKASRLKRYGGAE